ncbi:MAG: ATP-grasp domain-containing protein [Candidatus Nanopelagicales bacterium]
MAPPVRRPDVLLLATNPGLALAASRCLWDAGMTFQLVSTGRYASVTSMSNCVGSAHVDAAAVRDDDPALLETLQRALELSPSTVVVPAGLPATFFLSRHQDALPARQVFPVSSYDVLLELDDKWRFGELLGRLLQPHPGTTLVTSLEQAREIPVDDRLVLKPLAAEGSLGVRVVSSSAELVAAIEPIEAAGLMPVLVQEFIPGDDMGVNVIADHGEVLGTRVQKFEADGRLSFLDRPDAVAIATAVVKETGAHGVFNFDLRRDEATDRLFMTECNPRIYATSHKSAYSGMNPVALGVELARAGRVRVLPAEPTDVQPPLRTLKRVLRKQRDGVNPASLRCMDAEVRNPLSSGLRLAELRLPGLAERLRGEQRGTWAAFDAAQGHHAAW